MCARKQQAYLAPQGNLRVLAAAGQHGGAWPGVTKYEWQVVHAQSARRAGGAATMLNVDFLCVRSNRMLCCTATQLLCVL